jgi:RNA polymerase sigma-70 factor (ECF subfamily)
MAHAEAVLRAQPAAPHESGERPVANIAEAPNAAEAPPVRLRRVFNEQFNFVWRYLRRLGLSEADADDAAQQVFVVFSRKQDRIELGKERAYLCGTAVRIVSDHRRSLARRREVAGDKMAEPVSQALTPDQLADRQRARVLLDQVLDQMEMDLRAVFVLFELEELTTAQIAETLQLPAGTVASRLRRARESFHAIIKRMRATGVLPGGRS